MTKRKTKIGPERLAFDAGSRRRLDENGFLHVAACRITKEAVNEYYGSEIPGWRDLGLEPERVYLGWRPGPELARAAPTFCGLPLLSRHIKDSADDPQREYRVGNLGTDCKMRGPYLEVSLIIQDAEAIAALEPDNGLPARRELSASYRYEPLFEPGEFQGQRYDFKMINIRGNHVALVEEGRAGPDVLVADASPWPRSLTTANTVPNQGVNMEHNLVQRLKKLLTALSEGGEPDLESLAACLAQENPAQDEDPAELATGRDLYQPDNITHNLILPLLSLAEDCADSELAGRIREIVRAAGLEPASLPEAEADPGEFPVSVAADGKARARSRRGSQLQLAQDQAIQSRLSRKIRADLGAQIEAARLVRPLAGELDPMAFDSAGQIYRKALGLVGRKTSVSDPVALREMVLLACDAKQRDYQYPALRQSPGAKQGADNAAFAHLTNIRKA